MEKKKETSTKEAKVPSIFLKWQLDREYKILKCSASPLKKKKEKRGSVASKCRLDTFLLDCLDLATSSFYLSFPSGKKKRKEKKL